MAPNKKSQHHPLWQMQIHHWTWLLANHPQRTIVFAHSNLVFFPLGVNAGFPLAIPFFTLLSQNHWFFFLPIYGLLGGFFWAFSIFFWFFDIFHLPLTFPFLLLTLCTFLRHSWLGKNKELYNPFDWQLSSWRAASSQSGVAACWGLQMLF